MAPKRPQTHLTAERIQAFLDDALSRDERAEVQEHATFCGRCHTELETWQLLYSELGELPELSPAPNFRDRVLARPRHSRSGRIRREATVRVVTTPGGAGSGAPRPGAPPGLRRRSFARAADGQSFGPSRGLRGLPW